MADYKQMYLVASGGMTNIADKIYKTVEMAEESYTHSDYQQIYLKFAGEMITFIELIEQVMRDSEDIYLNTSDDLEEPQTTKQALQQAIDESEILS